MTMTWLRTLLPRAALAVALAFTIAQIPQAQAAAEPYEIDAMIDLTGSGSFTGHDMSQSLAGVEDYVNRSGGIDGRPLKFDIHDEQTSPQVAVQVYNEIATKHPAVLIGPAIASTCAAVAPLVTDIVDYCLSPSGRSAPGSYVFSSSTASSDQLLAIMHYFSARGIDRIATLTSIDATGQDAERGLVEAMGHVKGVDIVDREHFGITDLSVDAQIVRVKSSGAQLLIAWTTGTPFGTVLRSVSDEGLSVPVLTTAGNMSLVQLQQYGGIVPKELLFPAVPGLTPKAATNKATAAAIALFDSELAKQGAPLPGFVHQVVWDPAMLFVYVLRKLGPNATAAQVHDYIEHLRGWVGINGPYDYVTYPQRGLGLSSVVITKWDPAAERWDAVSGGGGA